MAIKHKTTTGDPLDRLTLEQKREVTEFGLMTEVGNACDKWLKSRGIAFNSSQFNQTADSFAKRMLLLDEQLERTA